MAGIAPVKECQECEATMTKKREPYRSCTVCTFGYCAPKRCYCGHPECIAYDSYIHIYEREEPA